MMKRKLFQSVAMSAVILLSASMCLAGCGKQPEPAIEESTEESGETKQNGYKIDATSGTAEGEAVEAPKPDDAEAVNGTSVNSKGEDTILGEDGYLAASTEVVNEQQENAEAHADTNNSNETLSMTDAEIKALLKKYDNITTVDDIKATLRMGTTLEELEEILQMMQEIKAENESTQNTTQVTQPTQQQTPQEEAIYTDPNYVHGQGDYSELSSTAHTY